MGIINRISKRCIFCKSKEGTEYIEAYGLYGGIISGDWIHYQCLREITCNPEKYESLTVDMAIDIIDRIKESKKRSQARAGSALRRCEYLRQHCI